MSIISAEHAPINNVVYSAESTVVSEERRLGSLLNHYTKSLIAILMEAVDRHRAARYGSNQDRIVLYRDDMLIVLDICELILDLLDKYEEALIKKKLNGRLTIDKLTNLRDQIGTLKILFTKGSVGGDGADEIQYGIKVKHNLYQYVPTKVDFFTIAPPATKNQVPAPNAAEIKH